MTEKRATVAGEYTTLTIRELARRCEILLAEEQEKPLPDNALIGCLCDCVRMTREFERWPPVKEPEQSGGDEAGAKAMREKYESVAFEADANGRPLYIEANGDAAWLAAFRFAKSAGVAEGKERIEQQNITIGELESELKRLHPSHYEHNGEAGDGQTVCDACGGDVDEDNPHPATECVKRIRDADGYTDHLLTSHIAALESALATAKAQNAAWRPVVAAAVAACGDDGTESDMADLEEAVDALPAEHRPSIEPPDGEGAKT